MPFIQHNMPNVCRESVSLETIHLGQLVKCPKTRYGQIKYLSIYFMKKTLLFLLDDMPKLHYVSFVNRERYISNQLKKHLVHFLSK